MSLGNNQLEFLKTILENTLQPQLLDTHPWTKSLIVRQACVEMPELQDKSPGQRLVSAVSKVFTQMMPTTAPRRGKRLDTRWGQFGILAAEYFAPLLFGEPKPASLREAWGHIDQSILLFVYGKPAQGLTDGEKDSYKLVGSESEVTPNSTLSDWHRNGLECLFEMILRRESYLSRTLSKPPIISSAGQAIDPSLELSGKKSRQRSSRVGCYVILVILILLIGGLGLGGYKAWQIYQQAMLVRQDALQMRNLASAPGSKLERIKGAGPSLQTLSMDFEKLKNESGPFLWLGPWLTWVPVYGGDLGSVQDLMNLADNLLSSANLSYQAVSPLLAGNNLAVLNLPQLSSVLLRAQPELIEAQQKITEATTVRGRLTTNKLTPEVRDLILKDVDTIIPLMRDGLSVAEELPRLLGATTEGPKTYLLLVENEDELRPTGGLVTAVGTLLIQNGQINSLTFENEDLSSNQPENPLVDWSKPYPAAPWQLQQYMNSQVLLIRDTSWFTNYPTAALYAESLYSYVKGYSVNGEIAFDQQFLVEVLQATGPIQVAGVSYPIDASNVVAYMRSAKTPTAADLASPDWNNKFFVKLISDALLQKITSGAVSPENLLTVLFQGLNEHHLILKFDNSTLTALLAKHRWDGAVRPEPGDFLMAVDTNVGFNKTNAVVTANMTYDVDLTKPAAPIGSLTIIHANNAAGIICKQWDKIRLPGEEDYPITDCYWNYMRIYTPSGTKLLDATPQFVPANWMLIKQDVPARVDNLNEGIAGVQAFGTLQVVPGGESVNTTFHFALPASIVQSGIGQSVYHLLVQKQPGTLAEPITIRVHLPNNASVVTAPIGAITQGQNILYQTDLQTDLEFEVVYHIP
jgi:Protein of unknown function (DUF4012)